MRVLLVEDDAAIAGQVARALHREGFDVDHVRTGTAALDAREADVVLLDLGLPDDQISMILGPSGTGKSVCIKHMVGLL